MSDPQEWISVETELPEVDQKIKMKTYDGFTLKGYLSSRNTWVDTRPLVQPHYQFGYISKWKPIEPPKDSEASNV